MSDTLEESLPAHAPLGPSSAEGWTTCADYVNANRGLPDFQSEVAAEGTAAHLVSDICLETGLDTGDLLGMTTRVGDWLFALEEDDADLLQLGIDKIRAVGGEFFGEHRVSTADWTLPGQFGTLDRAVIHQDEDGEWWIRIEDLKFGRGIAVTPVRNKQIILYALAFWKQVAAPAHPDVTDWKFKLVIDQPRHGGGGGEWNTTLEELLSIGEWIKERAALTTSADATRTASLHGCMWCRRRRAPGGCDTYDAYIIDLLGLTWDDIDLGILMDADFEAPRDLSADRRSWLLLHKGSIERWLDQLETEAMEDAKRGGETGLVKLVEGNKNPDKWKDKGAAATPVIEAFLGEKGFNKRLKTPKQVASVVGDDPFTLEEIEPFIERGQRRLTLVPVEDARPAILTGAVFDPITEEGE